MEIWNGFIKALQGIWETSGLASNDPRNYIMIVISLILIYLAIKKEFEPLLLLPIAFGMLMVNLYPSIMAEPTADANGGLFYYLYQGVKLGIYPPLIFLGIGAMTDFGPLLANPMSLLLGAAAQLGIFAAFLMALVLGFTPAEAAAIGVLLAKRLGYSFLDTDLVIQAREGALLQQLLDARGQEAFLEAEADAVCAVSCRCTVIATGGSAVYRTRAVERLRELGRVVYLRLPLDEVEAVMRRYGELNAALLADAGRGHVG